MISLCSAEDEVESDDNDEVISYGNVSNCIGKYRDLQMYNIILNNEDLMDNLTELYFETGETITEFVKITYRFGIPLQVENETNKYDTTTCQNNTRMCYNHDENEFTCAENQKTFIWSSAALYLLDPKPLLWLTLFAVHVHESSITIHLPCLCSEAHDDLLSRLTYLVSNSITTLFVFYNYIPHTCRLKLIQQGNLKEVHKNLLALIFLKQKQKIIIKE